jgi:hypothetical protein
MRFQMPSNCVCTPMEKGMMIQPPFRLMGVLPLLVMLPSTRTSMLLYGSAAAMHTQGSALSCVQGMRDLAGQEQHQQSRSEEGQHHAAWRRARQRAGSCRGPRRRRRCTSSHWRARPAGRSRACRPRPG